MSFFLTPASSVMCPHGGQAVLFTSNTQALLPSGPVLLMTDVHPVVGCTFAPGGVPLPCVTIQWLTGSLQSTINGVPALMDNSVGLCLNPSSVPQGTAIVVQTQTQASGL
ncbi:hypothetical protein [Pelomonas cellulosilytica]|uniref:DUF4280 domain-containing protein n=1 Tax=Pelomonas cellulosilytica TaxID=2906762 RepID=A0ABS8XSV3_9BURK|nr:hypothetical protein [Pelomonas sp. P8]MCE4555806.1 hypothetical protein [Pelomonas sp. P8]